MRGLALRFGVIAVIVVAGFVLRSYFTGNAGDLQVGDCFDVPTGTETVKDVQHHPCSDSHTGEVFFVGNFDNATFPTDADFQQYVQDNCLPAYTSYTGNDVLTTEGADFGYFEPTQDGWSSGDREVTCYATRADGGPMTGSLKKG